MLDITKISFKFIETPTLGVLRMSGKKNGQIRLLDRKYNMIYNFLLERFKDNPCINIHKSKTTFSIYISIHYRNIRYSIRVSDHSLKKYNYNIANTSIRNKVINNIEVNVKTFVDLYSLYLTICKSYKDIIKNKVVQENKLEDLYLSYSSIRSLRVLHPSFKNMKGNQIREFLLDNLEKVII